MAHSPTKFIKDIEGIAVALGIELFKKQPKLSNQLAALGEIVGTDETPANGFPKRDKSIGMYLRSDVVAWGNERLDVTPNGREFSLREPKKPTEELIKTEGGFEASLDLWEDKLKQPEKWMSSPLQQWQMKQLKVERPHLFTKESPEVSGENISGGQRGVANWIRNNFHGVVCNQTDIARWMRGEYLPNGCLENFPSYVEAGRYKTAQVRSWVERYLVKQVSGVTSPLNMDYRAAQEKLDYERAQEEFKVWQQANSDKYVETERVTRTGASIGSAMRNLTRDAIERQMVARFAADMDAMMPPIPTELKTRLKEMLQTQSVIVFTDWQARAAARVDELLNECNSI